MKFFSQLLKNVNARVARADVPRSRVVVSILLALVVMFVFASAAFAQGVNVQKVRALLVELSATVNQNLTVGGDTTVGDDLTVADDAAITDDVTVGGDIVVTGVITTTGGYIGITPVATATRVPRWCGAQSVNGAATVIPATLTAAGITTPVAPVAALGADITLDGDSVTTANASGVVTLKVWQLRTAATTTPQAATTPITVNYCVSGN
jgi:hypothetical protein